jgi:hypothetical protein
VCLVAWLATAAAPGHASDRLVAEYQMKAAYLYNFAKFVDWPATSFSSPTAPLVIGIYGDDPFGDAIDAVVRSKRTNGHPVITRRSVRMQDLRACHIVFVGPSREPVEAALAQLADRPVLTVGESEHFLRAGGIVQISVADGRLALTIDLANAVKANLTLSANLLRLAQVVNGPRR